VSYQKEPIIIMVSFTATELTGQLILQTVFRRKASSGVDGEPEKGDGKTILR
jgi:hypothetical protein